LVRQELSQLIDKDLNLKFRQVNKLLSLVFVLTFDVAQTQTVKKEDEQLIRESRRASNEALARRDIESFSKYWMKDFVQVRGNGTSLVGKDSITALWKKMFKTDPETSYIRTPTEIIIGDNDPAMAWETGMWTGIHSYSKGGNYSAMWRKQDGEWRIQAELYVSLH
jgi:uncharacterized protein (TIGR02246 family)